MSLNQIYCVSLISVALSVTLLYKNREKCLYCNQVIVHLCYRASSSTIVFHEKKLNQLSVRVYIHV